LGRANILAYFGQHKGLTCETQHNIAGHYAECCIVFIVMLNIVMLSVLECYFVFY